MGERFQLSIDAFGYRTGESPASGGVATMPALPFDKTLQLQLSGNSMLRSSDLWVVSLRNQNSPTQTIESLGLAVRLQTKRRPSGTISALVITLVSDGLLHPARFALTALLIAIAGGCTALPAPEPKQLLDERIGVSF